ncbi:hypothetical protein PVAND_007304 [Polypedilum vanderplanki]|uniref:Calcium uniporter protein n=1 Tax=Polypedilum vanderplanki TaxID=319348 RepID=A0A9J6C696_POLVA|nr:hypothetical protein PVAND_007304 [Polypedilum vanderplanki]
MNHDIYKTLVTVTYIRGLPNIICPLPSRNEKCQFVLRPVSHNVGDFLEMLKSEDRGIDRAAILNKDGVRIASSCSIESLMDESFWLHLNDKHYYVEPPEREKISSEEITKLGDVRSLVAQLYEALHVSELSNKKGTRIARKIRNFKFKLGPLEQLYEALHVSEYQIKKERELHEKLEILNSKLGPLEQKRMELDIKAGRKANVLSWVGLGLMSVQFGVLARLTWFEYSWDIMEPVTYFVTYGTAMAAYAYFVLTKQEYILPDVKDRQHLLSLHKAAKKVGLDLEQYNDIKRQIAELEFDLCRLRDPLYKNLPITPPKSKTYSASEIELSKKLKGILNDNQLLGRKSNILEKVSHILVSASKRLKK